MNIKRTKEKKLSIAFVIPTFIPETFGGAETQTLRLVVCLKNHDINSFILAPKIKKNTFKKQRCAYYVPIIVIVWTPFLAVGSLYVNYV